MKTLAYLLFCVSVLGGCLDGTPGDDGESGPSTSSELKAAPTCRIGGVTYAAGAANPADACETCEPSVTKRDWTVLDASCYDPPPPPACESSRDCGGQACIDGACTLDCTSDSQCSPPLHCVLGGSGCQL